VRFGIKKRYYQSPEGSTQLYEKRCTINEMLNDLQKTLKQQPEGNLTNALRQAVLGVFGSQVAMVIVAAIIARLILKLEQYNRNWWLPLTVISFGLFMLVSGMAVAELRHKTFIAALRASILLGAITSLPAVFAALLFVLEGSSLGAWILVFVTVQTLIFAIAQVSILGADVRAPDKLEKQNELEIVERFQGLSQNLDN
jgi:hypothetical protein